ncbi:hypothetical protein ElyMa_006837500 [Elysia marginata]|uniref:Uncharacterized protein n=1 Tax=Elysia marginata TaxID=1093978 RepID=A0AAV4J7Q6_9GAST|nr:hypothetical protein ElyMa_006837500 [Elysia marginata]
MKLLLAVVLCTLVVGLTHQARLPLTDLSVGHIVPIDPIPPRPIDPLDPRAPRPLYRAEMPYIFRPGVVSKRGDGEVSADVETGPKGTTGTVSGSYKTSGGTTIKGHVSHGPGGTSGGVSVSVPIQG